MDKKRRVGQNFLYGAVILIIANMLGKIFGVIFKIPISGIIYDEGMGYFNSAYNIYVFFYMVSTTGFPVAVSRMVAVSNSNGNRAETKRIFKVSMSVFVVLGIAGTAIMFFGAGIITKIINNPNAFYCIATIAPTLFFVCISSAYRGYFQGHQNMVPTAVSQVIESFGKLAIGIAAGMYARNMGYSLPIIAAYAICGITVGVAVGMIYLHFTKSVFNKKNIADEAMQVQPDMPVRSSKSILKELLITSVPMIISSSLLSLTNFIDIVIIMRRLQDIGFSQEMANKLYGAYTTKAVTLFNMPPAFIYPFTMSIMPVLAAAYAKKDSGAIHRTVESTFRIVSIISIPCALGMSALALPIIDFIFPKNVEMIPTEQIAPLLSILAVAIFFVSIVSVSTAMLQSQKFERKPLYSMLIGAVVKLVTSYILIGIPSIGLYGTPIGTILCYLTIMCINMYFLMKHTKYIPPIRKIFIKPLIAGGSCAIAAAVTYAVLSKVISVRLSTVAAILVAVAVYGILLLVLRSFEREDLMMLPKGEKILKVFEKFKLV